MNITEIPDDVLRLILEPFQRSELSTVVKLVCKKWNDVVQPYKRIENIVIFYCLYGYTELLEYMLQFVPRIKLCGDFIYPNAAAGGCIEVLEWAKHNEVPYVNDAFATSTAAAADEFEALQWLFANGFRVDEDATMQAACNGNLEMLQWLRENGCPWNKKIVYGARRAREWEVLSWILKNS